MLAKYYELKLVNSMKYTSQNKNQFGEHADETTLKRQENKTTKICKQTGERGLPINRGSKAVCAIN